MRPSFVRPALFWIGLSASAVAGAAPAIPPEAAQVIAQVRDASQRRDHAALRALMVDEFTWSFGGDPSAEQALQDWKANPGTLAQLRRATAGPCQRQDHTIECPRRAGLGHRAGFQQTPSGWRMVYFVAGD